MWIISNDIGGGGGGGLFSDSSHKSEFIGIK